MFFRNSFRIFKSDIRKLARNWVAIVIACGIALLPSLYAWINILASWDPYGNTGGIKVGIVNNDEGSQIQDININIGAELESQLKENKKLGWTFYDTTDEGIEQCRKGRVYATIIIPNDFSAKMATLLDETHVKPQLDYYVNEKINAIAPKMTDSGASTLQKQITESFTETVVEKVFDVLNPLGYEIDNHYGEIEKFKSLLNLVDDDLPQVADKMQYDSAETGEFFASLVELNTTKLFPVKNYGAGLTPFYTTLCLWVGALLMCALFTTKAHNADFEYTPNEEYMGKLFLFGAMAMVQGLIAALGDVFVLRVEIMHPILFVVLSMFYSVVFIAIVYTLVALFDNVGKAIGVVFLVFQLAGAGGTFPVQVMPEFFKKINAFLPFTYAINGMREAVAGIVMENLVLDIAVLLLYGAVFIALGLLLKRYASTGLKRFLVQLSDSGIIGH